MDTLIMTARVALLIIATGTFTAVWSGDHAVRVAAADRPTRVLVGNQSRLPAHRSNRPGMVQSVVAEATEFDSRVTALPLPNEITSGMYLVTDQWGQTYVRRVGRNDIDSQDRCAMATVKDHYVVERNGSRLHYIRLDDSVAGRLAESPSANHN